MVCASTCERVQQADSGVAESNWRLDPLAKVAAGGGGGGGVEVGLGIGELGRPCFAGDMLKGIGFQLEEGASPFSLLQPSGLPPWTEP